MLGGAAGAFAGARAGRAGAQRSARCCPGSPDDGLATTLSGQGLGHLVGGDRFTVLDALASLIAGDGSDSTRKPPGTPPSTSSPTCFPTQTAGPTSTRYRSTPTSSVRLLEMFLARYIYNRIPVIAERLARITDPAKAQRAEEDLQRMVESFVALRLPGDPLHVDWDGPEGRKIIEDTLQTVYEALEVLEEQ